MKPEPIHLSTCGLASDSKPACRWTVVQAQECSMLRVFCRKLTNTLLSLLSFYSSVPSIMKQLNSSSLTLSWGQKCLTIVFSCDPQFKNKASSLSHLLIPQKHFSSQLLYFTQDVTFWTRVSWNASWKVQPIKMAKWHFKKNLIML